MRYNIKDIATLLGGEIMGDLSTEYVLGLAPFFQAKKSDITFAGDEKFLKNLDKTEASVIIVPNLQLPECGKIYIKVNKSPRELMPKLLKFFKREIQPMCDNIEKSAKISGSAKISPLVYIGHDTEIGENTVIYPNVTICEGVKIGKNCIIYPNATIREFCTLGDNVIVQPGAVIGSDGFGFVKVNGVNTKIDQIGSVVIGNGVEIGANTTIDRGAIGDTIIGNYTKIDNLVQIAHNDILGENCLIVAQVGIAGSVKIGNNVTIAGQSGVAGHITLGDNIIIGGKSGVTGDLESNQILSGYPLVPHKEDLKIKIALKKLPELIKRVKKLEKLQNK